MAQNNIKLLVIEGLDGSGKSTQINQLQDYLQSRSIKYKYIHFPRVETGIYGDLIARFLRGDLGPLESVHPYLVALIYAGDRNDASTDIKQWLEDGYLVLLDRYVISNIAFQCAKMGEEKDQSILRDWIIDLEFEHFGLPRPDLNLFLDVPFSFTESKLMKQRSGEDRNYLNGKKDIHEESLDFQGRVRKIYLKEAELDQHLRIICPCNCPTSDARGSNRFTRGWGGHHR